ncbi:hypothetical protein L195_g054651, partial [Trifolium pratense]
KRSESIKWMQRAEDYLYTEGYPVISEAGTLKEKLAKTGKHVEVSKKEGFESLKAVGVLKISSSEATKKRNYEASKEIESDD